jgi:hypothetical protein
MNLFELIDILRYYKKYTEGMTIYDMKRVGDYTIRQKMIKSNIPIKKTMLKTGIIFLNKTRCVY